MATIPEGIAIHTASHLKRAIIYIQNKNKTQNLKLCDGINVCVSSNIAYEMFKINHEMFSKNNYKNTDKKEIVAHHFTQNFAISDNKKIDYQKALEITKETALKHFGADYQILFATHIDKEFIHTHMIVSSYSLKGDKYLSQGKTLSKFRKASDEICKKYELHTLDFSKHRGRKGMPYNRWYEKQQNYNWKDRIKLDIDRAILNSSNVDELFRNLDNMNYVCKFFTEKSGDVYLGIRDKKFKKPFSVNTKTLGEGYDLNSIKAKLENKDLVNKQLLEEPEVTKITYTKVMYVKKKYIPNKYKSTMYKILDLILNSNTIKPVKYIRKYPYSEQNNYYIQTLAKQLNYINDKEIDSYEDLAKCKEDLSNNFEEVNIKLKRELSNKNKLENVLLKFENMSLSDKEKYKHTLQNLDIEQLKRNIEITKNNIEICKAKLKKYGGEMKIIEEVEKTLDEMEKDIYIENATIQDGKTKENKKDEKER